MFKELCDLCGEEIKENSKAKKYPLLEIPCTDNMQTVMEDDSALWVICQKCFNNKIKPIINGTKSNLNIIEGKIK